MDPEIITKEQLYKLLHISKRKAKWMLDEGIIPCQNRGTKTHTYLIRMEDVRIYLARPNAERQRELPTGQFNAHPVRSRRKCENLPQRELREEDRRAFAGYLNELLADVPDDLSVLQASTLTGYCDKALLRWIADGTLYAVRICSQYHIPKVKLIEFLCSEGMVKKSLKHCEMIRAFYRE
mgnify:FL=1